MADAAVEAGEKGSGVVGDDGGFEVGPGESANGFEGAPDGVDDDFDFVFDTASRDVGAEIARDAAQFGQDVLGKVFKVFG